MSVYNVQFLFLLTHKFNMPSIDRLFSDELNKKINAITLSLIAKVRLILRFSYSFL